MIDWSLQDKLTEAFKLIRQQRVVARQNFSCCGSCAAYEIGTYIKEHAMKKFIGAVTYNRQDNETLESQGRVYIRYFGVEGLATSVEIGQLAKRIFESVGLNVEWDGDENTALLVFGVVGLSKWFMDQLPRVELTWEERQYFYQRESLKREARNAYNAVKEAESRLKSVQERRAKLMLSLLDAQARSIKPY